MSAAVQVLCHLGYEPDATDRLDLARLRQRFGIALPPPFDDVSTPTQPGSTGNASPNGVPTATDQTTERGSDPAAPVPDQMAKAPGL
jgi:hypothetical protein